MDKVLPVITAVEPFVRLAVKFCEKAWSSMQPYHPKQLLPALLGVFLLFFGGSFYTLAACFEAYRMAGYEGTKKALKDLKDSYLLAKEASKKDDEIDADGDGIADVKQCGAISTEELYKRKLGVVLKSVDPNKVSDAVKAIYLGLIAVIATLRLKFAQAVTIGATIGSVFQRGAQTFAIPLLKEQVPNEFHKWISPGVSYTCQIMGVVAAWMMQRVIATFHTSVRGSQILLSGISEYAKETKAFALPPWMAPDAEYYNVVVGALTAFGFWSQLSAGFSIAFPLNLILFPVTFAEWALRVAVGLK